MTTPRPLAPQDIAPLAQLWHAGWHETQAPHVPNALINLRTLASFTERLIAMEDRARCIGPLGSPLGICAIKPNELNQLFVSPNARGTGAAAALLADAEQRLGAQGTTSAFLDCLPENEPAIRFYSKCGWIASGIEIAHLDTSAGLFELPCLIFRKDLTT